MANSRKLQQQTAKYTSKRQVQNVADTLSYKTVPKTQLKKNLKQRNEEINQANKGLNGPRKLPKGKK